MQSSARASGFRILAQWKIDAGLGVGVASDKAANMPLELAAECVGDMSDAKLRSFLAEEG